jgi:hypothetical protein
MPSTTQGVFSGNRFSMFGVLIGILLLVGMLCFHAVLLLAPPCQQPFCSPQTDPAIVSYRAMVRILAWVSVVAMDLAVSISVVMAWIAGGPKANLPEGTKRGIFIFATVFLGVWLLFSWGAYGIVRFIAGP